MGLGNLNVRSILEAAVRKFRAVSATPLALPAPGRTESEIENRLDALFARSGEPWAASIASDLLASFTSAPPAARNLFLSVLAQHYGADPTRLDRAIVTYQNQRDATSMAELHAASESRRQTIIRELNAPQGGTLALLRMREHGLANRKAIAEFEALDADFREALASWFNRGFLALRRIDWSSPASLLRKIIDYEAVHEIRDWDDLRRRVEPQDRRCYAFFHPQMPDEPLIFVEVALTNGIPASIQALLSETRVTDVRSPTTAVFYSISNCQDGLRGVPFGSFLIKQTAELLKRELPTLKTFITLSPVPSFAKWLSQARDSQTSEIGVEERSQLSALDEGGAVSGDLASILVPLLARYLLREKGADGRPLDPVAKFHLGNGAQLEQIHWMADISAKGLKQSYGLMVNYLYDLRHIEANQQALQTGGEIAASAQVQKLAKATKRQEPALLRQNNHA